MEELFIFCFYKNIVGKNKIKESEAYEKKEKYLWKLIAKLIHDKRFICYILIELFTDVYAVALNFLPIQGLKIGISVLTMIKDMFAPISYAYFYDCFNDEDGTIVLGVVSSISNAFGLILPIVISLVWSYSSSMAFMIGAVGSSMAGILAAVMLPNVKNGSEKSEEFIAN